MDVYMMSKCPDAFRGMKDIAATFYDNQDDLDLRFNYIGNLNSTMTYGVSCLHGNNECFGNIQQLCVQEKTDANTTLKFVLCQNDGFQRIGSYGLFVECLWPVASWYSVVRCAMGNEGKRLLQNSIIESQHSEAKISLTFALNGNKRCVFDSGRWVDSEDACPGGGSVLRFSESIHALIG
ncbi:hypothetical protein COEREDRAFT_87851 [Coemansia reversa NRRL 1564]|uniref:Uncharacterized protein n=1 Tax=Coemansia reversa (strain ATCC 12441 / NRRL 1564) TaxID=763665 RepID=A0A2G5B8U3_COERN|nr:hypothetical protein COEREDRAFT_87851 [Coemansia reversa NRRL 1564]|eukprot:PIA15438.1 hypothetical protein COEREDRAFT_87851 [Coemansia reversa NRRL 1564]